MVPERALVVVCRYLGDVLLATPLARALKEAGYHVDWLVAPGTGSIIENQPFAEQIHTLEPSWAGTRAAIRATRSRYAVACVINGADRPMLVSLLAAKKVHALVPARAQDAWKRWLSTSWMTNTTDDHMVHYAIDLAGLAGIHSSTEVGLEWSSADEAAVDNALGRKSQTGFIHLHPFARWQYKLWPKEKWQALMRRLIDNGHHLVITGGPGEQQQAEALAAGLPPERIRILAGALSWAQLACLSHKAAAYIGMDTANTHLAASTGTPTLALFGPTDPCRWGPWPRDFTARNPYQAHVEGGTQRVGNVSLMQGLQPCVPCQLEGCDRHPESRSECLDTMPVERVLDELGVLLEQPR